MKQNMTVEEEVQKMLNDSMTTAEALKKIKDLSLPDWDNDPGFVADFAKGQITEDILAAMEAEKINKSELAKRLGKSRQYISRVLNETANFTIDSLAEIACALNRKIEMRMIGKNQHLFVADTYHSEIEFTREFLKTDYIKILPNSVDSNQEYSFVNDKCGHMKSNSPEFMVAEFKAEYKVNRKNENEKKFDFAS